MNDSIDDAVATGTKPDLKPSKLEYIPGYGAFISMERAERGLPNLGDRVPVVVMAAYHVLTVSPIMTGILYALMSVGGD